MTENERIKQVRKSLNLTLDAFGARVGVKKAAMSNIENGSRGVTDQMRRSICREFGVNENWLLTGEGEMFLEPLTQQLESIYQRHSLTPEDKIMVEEFLSLSPETRREILKYVSRVADRLRDQDAERRRQRAEELAWQLEFQEEAEENSSASQTGDSGTETKMA